MDVILWIQTHILETSGVITALGALFVKVYSILRKYDDKFKLIGETQEELEKNIKTDKEFQKMVLEHDEKFKQLDKLLMNNIDINEKLLSIDNKLSAITSFLVGDPSAHEKITIIHEKYKKDELEKFAK